MALITLNGHPTHTCGELPQLGAVAPDFRLVDRKLNDCSLERFAGFKKLISIVPSLDTPTCAESTREFNHRVAQMAGVALLVVSADLPFAQGRFCTTEGLSKAFPLSMMRDRAFARDYGVLIEDGPLEGVLARAVVVLGRDNRVLHRELVDEISREPDYEKALAALSEDD